MTSSVPSLLKQQREIMFLFNKKFLTAQFYILVILLIFLILSILLQNGLPFYENGIYVNYAQSILEDFDFNLMNQVSDTNTWLVTSSFHYPDFHPTVQTPFIILIYFFENITSRILDINFNNYFDYHLSSLTINFLITFFSFFYFIKLTRQYFDSKKLIPIFIVTTGSVYLFFSFFAANVTDVLSVPIISYVLYYIKDIEKRESRLEFFNFGIALGIISLLKLLYLPLVVFWLIQTCHRLIALKKYNHFAFLLTISLLPTALNSVNIYLKCKQWFLEVSTGAIVLFDYSASHIVNKLLYGYFGTSGFFSLNPTLLIGSLFFIILVCTNFRKQSAQKVFHNTEGIAYLVFLGILFFHPIFMLGEIVEDMLPGRATIATLPFLMIGFSYIYNLNRYQKYVKILSLILITWNIFVILNYLIISSDSVAYYYQNHFIFSFSQRNFLTNYLLSLKGNILYLSSVFPKIILFALMMNLTILLIRILKIKFSIEVGSYIFSYWLVAYFLMTTLNVSHSDKNVLEMKKDGIFDNKVIGDGADIYLHDYLFDRFYTIDKSSNGALAPELKKRAVLYYKNISPQIIKTTDEFENRRNKASWSNASMQ